MRLDPGDGTITVGETAIGPATALQTVLDAGGDHQRYDNGWQWVYVTDVEPAADGGDAAAAPRWVVGVSYDPDGRVSMVVLAHADGPTPADWSGWSEDGEMARRAFHDRWLADQLGPAWTDAPAQRYDGASTGQVRRLPWGDVASDYDSRSAGSTITLRYR
jgi:hypothetical protein